MTRAKGIPNRPKDIGELLLQVSEAAAKAGKQFKYSLEELSQIPQEEIDKTGLNRQEFLDTVLEELDLVIPDDNEDNPKPEVEEKEGFECGNCHAKFDAELPHCPNCQTPLKWE